MKINLSKIKNILNTKIDTVGDGLTKTNTTVSADIGNSSNTSSTKLVACNDTRLSDNRTPTAHNHNLTNVEHTSIELITVTYTDDSTKSFQLVSYNDTSLSLRSNNKIIQTSGTVSFTALLVDEDNNPLSGKTVQLYKGTDTLVGTMTDNTDGTYSYTYTGTGAGLTSFYAKYGNIQSETYEIIDALFYDKGLTGSGNHNDNWTDHSSLVKTRGNSYTTLSNNGSSSVNSRANNNNEFTGDFVIEWENYMASGSAYLVLTGTSDSSINFTNMGATDNCKVRIEVKELVAKAYIDGVFSKEYTINNRSGTDGLKIRFQFSTTDIKYANFIVYPI